MTVASRFTAASACALLVLAACAVDPPPPPVELRREALPHLQVPGQWTSAPGGSASEAPVAWLQQFDDAQLAALVAEAMLHNPDLRVASGRVQLASEYVNVAESKLYPQVNLMARGGGPMGGDASGLQGVGLFAEWELDLWGRVRAERAASEAGYEATVADAQYARQSIAALVVKSYYLAVEATLQKSLAERMVEDSTQLVGFAEQRERVGRGDGYDSALARGNVETFRDTVEQLILARSQALRALEVLVGRYPAASVSVATQLPPVSEPVPAGLPSELLERRPDVVAAERRVASSFYGIQQAKAARLPRIGLTATVNDVSSELFVLKDRDNPVWSVGASLLQPVFNAGALQSQVRISTAEQQLAVAEYGRVGARAFAEVEEALAAEFAAQRREAVLGRAYSENARALELAQVRYDVGSADLRAVRQQQLAVHAVRSTQLRVQAERVIQRVNLYLALGGDFGAPEPVATR